MPVSSLTRGVPMTEAREAALLDSGVGWWVGHSHSV